MNTQFLIAGVVALVAAGIHGVAGEMLILRRLSAGELPSSRFGGPGATMVMIRVTWHIVSATFLAFGLALTTCAFGAQGGSCRNVGLLAAGSFTAYLALSVWIALQGPRALLSRHRAPVAFLVVAVLAWWGTLAS